MSEMYQKKYENGAIMLIFLRIISIQTIFVYCAEK